MDGIETLRMITRSAPLSRSLYSARIRKKARIPRSRRWHSVQLILFQA